ncbi:hypothetical protein [Microbulbifer agarilyticus]|uniref:hypothetical protein n=1 Tax=Microbulbifer agarilyticus TaxID=260552 RepID=UPI001CD64EC0|nr:hypothetical protein [Microbulbifer agarilyticus]MCA0899180.1 hypothetical protein [Microbulbifer agarilyticus]
MPFTDSGSTASALLDISASVAKSKFLYAFPAGAERPFSLFINYFLRFMTIVICDLTAKTRHPSIGSEKLATGINKIQYVTE